MKGVKNVVERNGEAAVTIGSNGSVTRAHAPIVCVCVCVRVCVRCFKERGKGVPGSCDA